MGKKLILGPFDQGLRNDVTAFVIDNNSFPTLLNAYQWRGRVKRKRGTELLGRGTRYFNSTSISYNTGTTTFTLDGAGVGNLLQNASWDLGANATLIPGSVTITIGGNVYTDPAADGTLSPAGSINYASGQITIVSEAGNAASAVFRYYPNLPSMGFDDLNLNPNTTPGTLAFDTTYSYNVLSSFPYSNYDVSFYKNPASSGSYAEKQDPTPVKWNGQNYQQFYTTNYQNAFWATNGLTVPFNSGSVGMQYKVIITVTVITPTTASLNINTHGLTVGDFLFINEVVTTQGINFQTGYVTTVSDPNNVIVTFPNATLLDSGTGGIAQYLTRSADPTIDCMRWYDGDPTNASVTAPVLNGAGGWVNFCPPLSFLNYSINDLPADQYYLVTAKIVFSYRDRLVFLGVVVQKNGGSPIYLPDTAIFSQNGTPFYTASFADNNTLQAPTLPTTEYFPLLVPENQTATANAFFEDVIGYGGFRSAGSAQSIISMEFNEDVPIVGFQTFQTRFIYTSNDVQPFDFYIINSEYGTTSTFSVVNTDQGIISRGSRGLIITSQTSCQRIDPLIPDQVFQMKLSNNGNERMCVQRDFQNEWIYFTYPFNQDGVNSFPTETLFYNYRDQSWAIFKEAFTTYGLFRKRTGFTWQTVGLVYPTWEAWNDTWNSGIGTLLQPEVVGGNQQGFWILKAQGTGEAPSLYIKNISGTTVTSPDHCLESTDFITIQGCLGTIGANINGKVFQVNEPVTKDTFVIANPAVTISGTYLGNGTITKLFRPYIQTKQFPAFWEQGLKVRIGPQQYLFTTTKNGKIQLLIFLSQNGNDPYNIGNIVPDNNVLNGSLVYSTILFTCPESTNLGLTPANINLQSSTAIQQSQIWHRMNTGLLGDTVQIGFTLSNEQMLNANLDYQFDEIELHGCILDLSPAGYLA
jgi:hypothetical protein